MACDGAHLGTDIDHPSEWTPIRHGPIPNSVIAEFEVVGLARGTRIWEAGPAGSTYDAYWCECGMGILVGPLDRGRVISAWGPGDVEPGKRPVCPAIWDATEPEQLEQEDATAPDRVKEPETGIEVVRSRPVKAPLAVEADTDANAIEDSLPAPDPNDPGFVDFTYMSGSKIGLEYRGRLYDSIENPREFSLLVEAADALGFDMYVPEERRAELAAELGLDAEANP
jgi:hypothetical protein